MKDMKFVLKLQMVWVAAALGFHLVSLYRVSIGLPSISLNSPLNGLIGVGLFIPVIALGWRGYLRSYGILNGVMLCFIFYFGYLFQVLDYFSPDGLSRYASIPAWFAGVVTNTYGIPVGFFGSYLALSSSRKKAG